MYFDAVLTDDLEPIFNGTREEVHAWLDRDEDETSRDTNLQVCDGRTLKIMSVDEYLARK